MESPALHHAHVLCGGVRGHTDLTGEASERLAFKSDDVRGGGVVHEVRVDFGECRVGEENQREFAGRAAAEEGGGVFVQDCDGAGDRSTRYLQTRMAIVDGELA